MPLTAAVAWLFCASCSGGDGQDSPWQSAGGQGAPAADGGSAGERPASYHAVAEILQRSCAYVRCHDGPLLGGHLRFAREVDFATQLVNVPACEYEGMARVTPGDPERSWLLLKLTAQVRPSDDPYADYILFEPDEADWDPSQRGCRDQTDDGTPLFGQRMPATAPNMLPEAELETIRAWIAEGAPH